MLLTKSVIMKWTAFKKGWYVSKGYVFTKMGDDFEVKVEDITDGSHVLVNIRCDGCGEIIIGVIWQHYIDLRHEDGKYYCHQCAMKLYAGENGRITKLQNGKSFEQWCYDNLPKRLADYILSRWDYEKNIKNGKILSPKDIGFSSMGFNRKGYWFKCFDNPEHGSELKDVSSFTSGQTGSLDCNMCNTVATTHPHLIKYLVNIGDANKYSFGSNPKIPMKCPDCGYEKNLNFNSLVAHGFSCPRCSDGVSYPEKFFLSFLEQLHLSFKVQLSKTTFEWCNNYKYDFFINEINEIICECHGLQHYKENHGSWKMSLEEIQDNDFDKEWLSRINNIKNYIILDCRKSELKWIKDSIIKSRLPWLLNFKEEDIDWLKCHEAGCSSLVKKSCDLWNSGSRSTIIIASELKVHAATITTYLKQGAELGWCDYNTKEIMQTKVVCLTTNEIFDSIIEGASNYNIRNSDISSCCLGIQKSAGKHPETGEKMVWMYYEEYIFKDEQEIDYILLHSSRDMKIICLTTNKVFNSITNASKEYNINRVGIGRCCKNKQKTCGKDHETGELLKWMYLVDYENMIKDQNNKPP